MKPKRFFRLCLLLPLTVPLVLGPADPTSLLTLLWSASIVGGLPYLAFAVLLFIWLGRLVSMGQSRLLSVCAPPLFLLFFGSYLILVALASTPPVETVFKAWNLVLDLAGLVLLVGYVYVVLANVIGLLLRWFGALEDSNAVQANHRVVRQ